MLPDAYVILLLSTEGLELPAFVRQNYSCVNGPEACIRRQSRHLPPSFPLDGVLSSTGRFPGSDQESHGSLDLTHPVSHFHTLS